MEALMTLREMCQFVHVSPHTMRRWLTDGIGPKVLWTPKGRRRFQRSDVIVWRENFFKAEKLNDKVA